MPQILDKFTIADADMTVTAILDDGLIEAIAFDWPETADEIDDFVPPQPITILASSIAVTSSGGDLLADMGRSMVAEYEESEQREGLDWSAVEAILALAVKALPKHVLTMDLDVGSVNTIQALNDVQSYPYHELINAGSLLILTYVMGHGDADSGDVVRALEMGVAGMQKLDGGAPTP